MAEKNIPNCAGFSFRFKARGRHIASLCNCRATHKLDDKDKQVGIFFDRNRLIEKSWLTKLPCAALGLILCPELVMGATLMLDSHLDSPPSYVQYSAAPHPIEKILMDSLSAIREKRMDTALHGIETLIEKHPEFRLAQLIYGDLLLSKGHWITNLGNHPDAPQDKLLGLREEIHQRVKHYSYRPAPNTLPSYLIRPGKDLARLVIVDIDQSRLYVFEHHRGRIRLRGDYYASVGKNGFPKRSEGDQKTPIGLYVTTKGISSNKLPNRYGIAAFPVDYPNKWDKRLGRTGHGIWIHGVSPDTYSRPPRSSDGCIAVANQDLLSIKEILAVPNTPVIITEHISWTHQREIAIRRNRFEVQFDRWRRDWESRDNGRYAGHYARDFENETGDRASWLEHKRRVNAKKQYIEVSVSNLSILGYPGEPDIVQVTFDQDYRSSNYNLRSKKRQYWRKENDGKGNGVEEDGVWRIVYEDTLR
uniref:Murein L,D-transpeptidase YafK n=2 Tax=Candidatus Kentrum sp. FM TaxID=2126340 RepID=A0A450TWK3_9GAMM|nr:MAG: Murein L,D-transpeptidase YafK [Candidatus Kentron sp. FM]VFK20888.1 MAG: Murein L,D-transpeptidase YafK [Candidatus Kentron sp. FM]